MPQLNIRPRVSAPYAMPRLARFEPAMFEAALATLSYASLSTFESITWDLTPVQNVKTGGSLCPSLTQGRELARLARDPVWLDLIKRGKSQP